MLTVLRPARCRCWTRVDFLLAGRAGIWRAVGRNAIKTPSDTPTPPASTSHSHPAKRWVLIAVQSLVTVGLLAFFFHDAEFRAQAWEAILTANGSWLLIGIMLAGIENLLGVVRWRLFLRLLGIEVPFWKSAEICLVALFCNTFMLGAVGGDLVRVAYLVQRGNTKTVSLLSIIMDRTSGLGGLLILTIIMTVWNYDWLIQSPVAAKIVKFVILYQVVSLLFLGVALLIAAKGWTGRLPAWAPARKLVCDLSDGYAKFATHWPVTLAAVGQTLLMLVAYFAVFYCSARAFGAPITFPELCAIMPSVDVISAMPISIGGMGVREQVFVRMLGDLAGVSAAAAFSISMTGFLVNCSWGLVGAAILPFNFKGIIRRARQEAAHVTD